MKTTTWRKIVIRASVDIISSINRNVPVADHVIDSSIDPVRDRCWDDVLGRTEDSLYIWLMPDDDY